MKSQPVTQRLDQLLAAPMFALSIVALALFATVLHTDPFQSSTAAVRWCLIALALLYPAFWAETIVHRMTGGRNLRQHILYCLIPILRIGARDHEEGNRIWLPTLGWQTVDRDLERLLTRMFSVPMIVIALLVLPVIIIDIIEFFREGVESNRAWFVAKQIAVAFIWSAFTFEFVVMISIVKWPANYARRHWIDLAIILLPLLAFLRALRLTQLLRLKQLVKAGRVYRLRGLGLRMWRGVVALEFIEKLLSRNPERRLAKLEAMLEDKLHEVDRLKLDIERMQKRIEEKKNDSQTEPSADATELPSEQADQESRRATA